MSPPEVGAGSRRPAGANDPGRPLETGSKARPHCQGRLVRYMASDALDDHVPVAGVGCDHTAQFNFVQPHIEQNRHSAATPARRRPHHWPISTPQ